MVPTTTESSTARESGQAFFTIDNHNEKPAEWPPWPTALDLRQEDVTVHQGETPTHRHN